MTLKRREKAQKGVAVSDLISRGKLFNLFAPVQTLGEAYGIIQGMDTVDAVPVLHGRWRHYEGMLTCSECGMEFYDDIMEYCGDHVPKFCPDCGADMREDGGNGSID